MMLAVLVADADRSWCDACRQSFADYGYEVETAAGGLECLAKLRQFLPAVLVLDLELPWGGGEGVLARMREDLDLPYIPVIVLSTRPDHPVLSRVAPPIREYLVKPVAPANLARTIRQVLATPSHLVPLDSSAWIG